MSARTPEERWDRATDGYTTGGDPLSVPMLHAMIDKILDVAREEDGKADNEVSVSEFWEAEDLPRDGDRIYRQVNGRDGHYKGHAYRDALIDRLDCKPWLVIVSSYDGKPTYYGDLRTGQITTSPPPDAIVTD